jgi:hypothetical protein
VETITEPGIRKPLYKKAGRAILVLCISTLVIICSLVALLFIYENEVKQAIVTELNKHLKAEVRVDPRDIDLTIIKTFPDCSIEFRNLLMLEALPVKKRDTLLFAGQLNLHFNIQDLWNKKYNIKKIKIQDGLARLVISPKGKPNYIFWEESGGKGKDSIQFNLQHIGVKNFQFAFKNKQVKFKTSVTIRDLVFKGIFRSADYDMNSSGHLFVNEMVSGKTSFLKKKQCDFDMELAVRGKSYQIKKAAVELNKLGLSLAGELLYEDSLQRVHLKYTVPDLDIASLLSLLPAGTVAKMEEYESSGDFYASGEFDYKEKSNYELRTDFGIKGGSVTYKANGTTADHINLQGSLRYGSASSKLVLKNFAIRLNNDEMTGSCTLKDFADPSLAFAADASLNLENVLRFWPVDTIRQLRGNVNMHVNITGRLEDLRNNAFSTKVGLELNASASNLEIQFKKDEKLYAVESVSLIANDREMEVRQLKLRRGNSDIMLNGKIPGIFNYLLDRKSPLVINGTLSSRHLGLDDFLSTGQNSTENNKPLIPANVRFALSAGIGDFTLGKFNAKHITGDIEIHGQKAIVSDMKFETMEGSAVVNAFADNSRGPLDVVLEGDLKGINVSTLFSQLNNFGQATLQDKNIGGVASANIVFSGQWSNALKPEYRSIQATCDLNIERGVLRDFKPLLSLSRFVDVAELGNIRFSTLQTRIQIANSTITIPKTTINNSALNIDYWGTHTFDNAINYHFKLLLSELLSKKRKKQDDEFGPVANDRDNRRSAFILMTGTVENPIIKYDRQGLKEKIREDIRQEKQNMKAILKEEFGLFKKDSINTPKRNATAFELEKPEKKAPLKTLEAKKRPEEEDF